jgi:hypothetical protein
MTMESTFAYPDARMRPMRDPGGCVSAGGGGKSSGAAGAVSAGGPPRGDPDPTEGPTEVESGRVGGASMARDGAEASRSAPASSVPPAMREPNAGRPWPRMESIKN